MDDETKDVMEEQVEAGADETRVIDGVEDTAEIAIPEGLLAEEGAKAEEDEDDGDDRGMMAIAALAGVAAAAAIIGAVVHFGLFGMVVDRAQKVAAAEVTQESGTADPRPEPRPVDTTPVNSGGNAADVSDVTPRASSAPSTTEEPQELPEYEVEPELEPIEEERTWVEEQGHYEDVYETQQVLVGQQWVVDSPEQGHYEDVLDEEGNVVDQQYVVDAGEQGHYEDVYETQQVVVGQQWVVDVPGHWE